MLSDVVAYWSQLHRVVLLLSCGREPKRLMRPNPGSLVYPCSTPFLGLSTDLEPIALLLYLCSRISSVIQVRRICTDDRLLFAPRSLLKRTLGLLLRFQSKTRTRPSPSSPQTSSARRRSRCHRRVTRRAISPSVGRTLEAGRRVILCCRVRPSSTTKV